MAVLWSALETAVPELEPCGEKIPVGALEAVILPEKRERVTPFI
jgi:hypothetical protein